MIGNMFVMHASNTASKMEPPSVLLYISTALRAGQRESEGQIKKLCRAHHQSNKQTNRIIINKLQTKPKKQN
jgi:hypothetical protein